MGGSPRGDGGDPDRICTASQAGFRGATRSPAPFLATGRHADGQSVVCRGRGGPGGSRAHSRVHRRPIQRCGAGKCAPVAFRTGSGCIRTDPSGHPGAYCLCSPVRNACAHRGWLRSLSSETILGNSSFAFTFRIFPQGSIHAARVHVTSAMDTHGLPFEPATEPTFTIQRWAGLPTRS